MYFGGRIVCIGVNPCFDVTLTLKELDDDKVNRVQSESRHAAGVAVNIARRLRSLRVQASVCGIAGQDNLKAYTDELVSEGIRSDFVPIPGAIRENLTVLCGGKTYKINRSGPICTEEAVAELRGYLNQVVSAGDIVVFGGAPANGMSIAEYASLMQLAGALGMRVVVDTDVLKADHLFRIKPYVAAPNIHELEYIMGRRLPTYEDRLEACRELVRGGVENVLLTLGSEGLMAVSATGAVKVPSEKIVVENTVGAGDSALAGFLCCMCEGQSLAESARFAARFAESVIKKRD